MKLRRPIIAFTALGGYATWSARPRFLEIAAEPKIRAGLLSLLRDLPDQSR